MDGGVSTAAIEVLVQNLINVFKEEYFQIRDLDEDAQQLQTTLGMIQGYLNNAEKKSITQDAVKSWLRDLQSLAFDADNVLDELSYHLLHKKVKKMKTLKHKVLLSSFSSFNHFLRPRNMAVRIKQINTAFESMDKRATVLGLQSIVVNAPAAAAFFETDYFTVDPIFIGRDDDVPKLVDVLCERVEERSFSILAIVGMGGMGKTTLTRKVFNHEKMKNRFGSLIWVHVSQTFDPIILFKKILKELTFDRVDVEESRQVILKMLQAAFKAKTYLLVLDDVWNEDLSKWDDFINSISGITSTKGNGILMTTGNQNVASIVSPLHIHPLNGLSNEECWSIIKAKAFENGKDSKGFEMMGRKMAKRCQGLPLAANVVGGVLLRCKSEEEWRSINENWLSDGEGGENITKILKLSFDHLASPSLKKCFAYCSSFPKGVEMEKQELIELWMAEGYLQADERSDMESVGNKFLNVLLHNSLLLVANRGDDGNVEICVMHDLVHDLATSVLGNDSKARYMIHKAAYQDEPNPIPKESAKYLRTLFSLSKISGTIFPDFESLHVLTLTSKKIRELPNSIRKLIHLRKLNITNTSIKSLTEWIGELHHLQTLGANTGKLKKLPSTLKYLINLRHLYIDYDAKLPAEIGRLTCLQTLQHFTVGDKRGSKIEELGSLKNLKGTLKIYHLEKVHDKEEALKANIFQKSNLSDLWFEWDEGREGERNDLSVLEGLQLHANIKKLKIVGFKGKRFPLWTEKMAVRDGPQDSWVPLNKLIELTLWKCKECEELPTLEHLPNLKSLNLKELKKVRFINSPFNNLMSLFIEGLEGLECLPDWLFYNNPNLSKLEISNCPRLNELPDGLHTLNSLKELPIRWCRNLKSIGNPPSDGGGQSQGFLNKLTSLHIEDLMELEYLPDWLFYNIPNLSKLKISNCRNLKSIGNPPSDGGGQSQEQGFLLRKLSIQWCAELIELPRKMVELWAPSLESISLEYLSSLKNLPMVIDCLAKSAGLKELEIVRVPKLIDVESWPFSSLQHLRIDASMEWSRESSVANAIKETLDGILQGCCHSLTRLHLVGSENWDWVPASIQHLTSVTSIVLEDFGIEELPEWFGNLTSLEVLRLVSCERLRRMPSGDAPEHLTELYILFSPELDIDSGWRNVPQRRIRVSYC